MMKLCLLFAVATANRVAEFDVLEAVDEAGASAIANRVAEFDVLEAVDEAGASKPKKGGKKRKENGIDWQLMPGSEFGAMKHPVLSHQMEIKPGAPDMAMDIQETGSGLKAYNYEFEVVGPNGPLKVGYLRSKAPGLFSTRTKYEFQTTSSKSMLRMYVPWNSQAVARKTAYVTSNVKKNPYTYYTFSSDGAALYQGGMSADQAHAAAGEVVFSVFKGKTFSFDTPYLQARGHFAAWKFQFYLEGKAEPVAVMEMTDNKYNAFWGTTKQRYRIKMQSGVDPIMLSMLIGFIDSCNNNNGARGYGGGHSHGYDDYDNEGRWDSDYSSDDW